MYVCTMLHFEKQSTVAIAHTHTRRAASTTTDEKLLPTHYLPLFTHFTTLPTVIQIVTRHKAISISLNVPLLFSLEWSRYRHLNLY